MSDQFLKDLKKLSEHIQHFSDKELNDFADSLTPEEIEEYKQLENYFLTTKLNIPPEE